MRGRNQSAAARSVAACQLTYTRSLALWNPGLTGGGSADEPSSVIMHPHLTEFVCTKIALEILGATNVDSQRARFYLLSIAE
jgi:hypothetical protein